MSFSQNDTIYGTIKSIREQLIFLNHNQNLEVNYKDSYGHCTNLTPQTVKTIFLKQWYNTPKIRYRNSYKEFNKNGKLTHEIWLNTNGSKFRSYQYKYDERGNTVQIKKRYTANDYVCRNFSYNSKNKLSSSIYYSSINPNLYSYTEYLYNNHNLVKIKSFDEYGERNGTKFQYDSLGRKIKVLAHSIYSKTKNEKKIKDKVGIDRLQKEIIYNDNNRVIKTIEYYIDYNKPNKSVITRKTKYIYTNDLLTHVYKLDSYDTLRNTTKYIYDINKRKIEKTVFDKRHLNEKLTKKYFYNDRNYIEKLIYIYKEENILVEFKYFFDKHKNWIKQIKSVNGKKLYLWKRKIKYYN